MLAEDIRGMLAPLLVEGGDWEIKVQNIMDREVKTFVKTPPNLVALYAPLMQAHGDLPFLVYENETLSFKEYWDRASKLAAVLRDDYGFKAGDHAAVLMRNYPEWAVSFLAIQLAGGVSVPMNSWWMADELEYGLKDSGATILFVDQERLDRFNEISDKPKVEIIGARLAKGNSVSDINELIDAKTTTLVDDSRLPEDAATIMYTSGTTGHPKGVVLTHRSVIAGLQCLVFTFMAADTLLPQEDDPNAPDQEAILMSVPLFHITGLNAILLASALAGRRVVFMYKWDAGKALELIERERITSFTGVPTMVWDMMKHPDFDKTDVSSLKSIGGGGAPAPETQVAQVNEKFNGSAGIGYGLTETNAVASINSGSLYELKPKSCGFPTILGDIKICDENGNDLGLEKEGEVCIRGPFVFKEYLNRPEDTAKAFFGDYFRSGDIGYFDHDGFLFISDRLKDIIIRGGENISCIEVENSIYDFPGVQEATVYGIPEERLGEVVGATVVPQPGKTIDANELKAFLTGKIAKYMVPEHLRVQTELLPRGATGKILKREERSKVVQEMGLVK